MAHRVGERPEGTAPRAELSVYSDFDRERFVSEEQLAHRRDRDDFARDRARVVHSASLRRLSTKTQVWQAGSDDFVRNRLTHSLEVAQIGRELAVSLGANADVVDAACLAHDLGHPPFGHFGETVLASLSEDFGGFEGNAQTFRLLTRLEAKRFDESGVSVGLNLTRATLDASIKYPWGRGEQAGTHKFGVYPDDLPAFRFARLGAPAQTPTATCLEAQIMDWADDVAYSVHDLEDGIAADAIRPAALRDPSEQAAVVAVAQARYAPSFEGAELTQALEELVRLDIPAQHDGTRRDMAQLKNMTSKLVGRFALAAEQTTREHFGSECSRYQAQLVVPREIRAQVAVLKATAAHFIMMTDARASMRERQRETILALFAYFQADPSRMDASMREDYDAADHDAAALRVIVDQVASLTDGRALRLAAEAIKGN